MRNDANLSRIVRRWLMSRLIGGHGCINHGLGFIPHSRGCLMIQDSFGNGLCLARGECRFLNSRNSRLIEVAGGRTSLCSVSRLRKRLIGRREDRLGSRIGSGNFLCILHGWCRLLGLRFDWGLNLGLWF